MWTHNAFGDAPEQLILHLHKLGRLSQFQDFLHLVEKQHLLGSVGGRPQTKCAVEDHGRQPRVFLRILRHAIRQLLVEAVQSSHLVQRNQGLLQHDLVLLLHRERKPVDDAAQNLKQFGNSIVGVALVNDLEEEILDGLANEGPQGHEFAIDSVEDGLQVVTLSWILRIKQIQELEHEGVVDKPLGDLWVHVIGYHKPKEELVDDLQVGPGSLQRWFILLIIEQCIGILVYRRQGAENVRRHHSNYILHHRLIEAVPGVVHVLHNFKKSLALRLLLLHLSVNVKIVHHRACL
mmetsp:Transcript_50543/g.110589  ORF Transcript_50543/g.110589 Transcript_50543/m.110589 type:complete len:292 (+) Transcript_50543:505-1380(+)